MRCCQGKIDINGPIETHKVERIATGTCRRIDNLIGTQIASCEDVDIAAAATIDDVVSTPWFDSIIECISKNRVIVIRPDDFLDFGGARIAAALTQCQTQQSSGQTLRSSKVEVERP